MNTKKPTIAIDMDGVLADVESHYIAYYYQEYGVRIPPSALQGKPESEGFPDKTAVRRFLQMPGFFSTVPVMEDAVETVRYLMDHFDVYIVSAAMEFPFSLFEKREWLQQYFPFISWKKIIFCGDKSRIDTDYMIDDHCKNLDFCKGKPILFHASHNIDIDRHQRVHNWQEVRSLLEKEIGIPC